MNIIGKLAIGAVMASGIALTAAAPAEAGVYVGIGAPAPVYGPRHHWCYYHPGACGRPGYVAAPVYVGPPAVGVFVAGRGYWDGHGWYRHRYWNHGGWRYR